MDQIRAKKNFKKKGKMKINYFYLAEGGDFFFNLIGFQ